MSDQAYARRASDQQNGLDSRALEIAVEAKAIILNHEKTCDADRINRNRQMNDLQCSFAEMNERLSAAKAEVARLINRGMAWMIGILVITIGYFLATFGLPGVHH
jgi:hypothetical protein